VKERLLKFIPQRRQGKIRENEIRGFYFVIDRSNSDSDEFFGGPIRFAARCVSSELLLGFYICEDLIVFWGGLSENGFQKFTFFHLFSGFFPFFCFFCEK